SDRRNLQRQELCTKAVDLASARPGIRFAGRIWGLAQARQDHCGKDRQGFGPRAAAIAQTPLGTVVRDYMENVLPDYIASIGAKDGVTLAAAVYLPKGKGRYPPLFAASPYRFDNNL